MEGFRGTIRRFFARRFKCFSAVEVPDLGRVTLIAGRNSVGKTALLEGIFLAAGSRNPNLVLQVRAFRGLDRISQMQTATSLSSRESFFDFLFHDFDSSSPLELGFDAWDGSTTRSVFEVGSRDDLSGAEHVVSPVGSLESSDSSVALPDAEGMTVSPRNELRITTTQPGGSGPVVASLSVIGLKVASSGTDEDNPRQVLFMHTMARGGKAQDAERFGELLKRRQDAGIVEALRGILPGLQRLVIAPVAGTSVIHADVGLPRLLPIMEVSEGVSKVLNLLVCMSFARGGVVLIDEFENGIHHSVLGHVWSAVFRFAEETSCQVIATTHSLECIRAAQRASLDAGVSDVGFRFCRLDGLKDGVVCTVYEPEEIATALESELEVR